MEGSMPSRADVPERYRWNTYSVFPSDEAWEEALQQATADVPAVGEFAGRLAEGPGVLADCLERYENTLRRIGHLYIYASNFHNVDTADQEAAARNDRARALFASAAARGAYIEPELLAIGFDTVRRWIAEEPRLSHYGHYVDELERRQAHVRSAEVEEILGALSDPFRSATSAHGILADADLTFEPARGADGEPREVAQGTIDALLMDDDREVRRTAWESYADAHLATRNTMATIMATGVKQRVFTARARRYETALEASLDANNIPVAVYHNVVDTFRANLHVWHKYWRIRRRALGYDALHVYDIKAPLGKTKPRVSLDEAIEHVTTGRECFMPGVLLAIREVRNLDGLVMGLDNLLMNT